MIIPFFCFCRIPSDSFSVRHHPPDSVLGRIWPLRPMATCLYDWAMMSGRIFGNPTAPGPNFGLKSADSMSDWAIFLHPTASGRFRHRPFRVASGPCVRWRHVWLDDDVGGGGGGGAHFWKRNRALAEFRGKSAADSAAYAIFSFRQIPPAAVLGFFCGRYAERRPGFARMGRRCVLDSRPRDSSVPIRRFRTARRHY